MSDVETLQKKHDALAKQIEKMNNIIKGQQAQIQAHKQLLGEQMEAMTVMKTNHILMSQAHQDQAQRANQIQGFLDAANKNVEALVKENNDLRDQNVQLLAKLNPPAPVAEEPVAA